MDVRGIAVVNDICIPSKKVSENLGPIRPKGRYHLWSAPPPSWGTLLRLFTGLTYLPDIRPRENAVYVGLWATLGRTLGLSGRSLGNLGPSRRNLGPSGWYLGPSRRNLGPSGWNLGPSGWSLGPL